ncbi:MAG: hypothetical protein NXI31_08000 [bacterium]|nr:hypothetical protein [bacterium]
MIRDSMFREAIVLGAIATLAIASWSLQPETAMPITPATISQTTPAHGGKAAARTIELEPATGAVAAQTNRSIDRSRQLELPDGTFVEALNDAVDAAPIAQYWGTGAWSPIVAVERSSAGIDWYRHENGSFSTTQMVWRADLGRHLAMTRVAHVGPEPAPAAAATATRR